MLIFSIKNKYTFAYNTLKKGISDGYEYAHRAF